MRQVVAGTTTIEEDQLGMGISWEMLTRVTWIGSNDAKVKVAITTVTLVLSTRCNYIYNGKNSFIGLLGSQVKNLEGKPINKVIVHQALVKKLKEQEWEPGQMIGVRTVDSQLAFGLVWVQCY